jgi:hypothetical protein
VDIFEYAELESTISVLHVMYTVYIPHTSMYVLGMNTVTETALLCSTNRMVFTAYLLCGVTKVLNILYAMHFIIR